MVGTLDDDEPVQWTELGQRRGGGMCAEIRQFIFYLLIHHYVVVDLVLPSAQRKKCSANSNAPKVAIL